MKNYKNSFVDNKFVFTGLFAVIGFALLVITQAANPVAHFEAESASLSSNAGVAVDESASAGQFIKFSGGSQSSDGTVLPGSVDVKSTCKNTSTTANGTHIRTDFPHDGTTGPEVAGLNEDKLPPSGVSGRWTITQSGAVIDSVYHNGIIDVKADNVTIKNSVICGRGGLVIRSYNKNLLIENSIVRGERDDSAPDVTPCPAGVGYGNYTLVRSELTWCADGIKTSGYTDVRNNWFHDNYTYRLGSGAGTHNDTAQQAGSDSSYYVFNDNSAYQDPCTSNRHFQMAPTNGVFSAPNLRIQNNFFYGIMGFNFDRDFTAPGGIISSNIFAGTASKGPFSNGMLYSGSGMGTVERFDNVFESGEPADNNPGGYQCAAS